METQTLSTSGGSIAFDDTGGDGPLVVMIPGAGDIRSEYRFVAPMLAAGGARVVTMDMRGHGESSPKWDSFEMADTAADLIALLEHLDAGPATVVGTSFSPTAALWATSERPDLIDRLVLISAHLESPPEWQRQLLGLMMRGPLAAPLWASQFRGWHPGAPPADLDEHIGALRSMVADPDRRRAARETLIAVRDGLAERTARVRVPTLVIMGGADSHFKDPAAVGAEIAEETGGTLHVVADAGHYPHVEYPDQVAEMIGSFLATAS